MCLRAIGSAKPGLRPEIAPSPRVISPWFADCRESNPDHRSGSHHVMQSPDPFAPEWVGLTVPPPYVAGRWIQFS